MPFFLHPYSPTSQHKQAEKKEYEKGEEGRHSGNVIADDGGRGGSWSLGACSDEGAMSKMSMFSREKLYSSFLTVNFDGIE